MTATAKSKLIAKALAGSWRPSPPPFELSNQELEIITPSLLETGAGGLAWRRVRSSSLENSEPGFQLQQAYRLNTLQAACGERDINSVLRLFLANATETILAKGWSV